MIVDVRAAMPGPRAPQARGCRQDLQYPGAPPDAQSPPERPAMTILENERGPGRSARRRADRRVRNRLSREESRLPKAERRKLLRERTRKRVEERRAAGDDVVAYALANPKAVRFLTVEERSRYTRRRAEIAVRRELEERAEDIAAEDALSAWKNAAALSADRRALHRAAERAYQETRARLRGADRATIVAEERRIDERSIQRAELIRSTALESNPTLDS